MPRPSQAMLMSRKCGVLFSNKADISIKLVKVFQNSGDCVASDPGGGGGRGYSLIWAI